MFDSKTYTGKFVLCKKCKGTGKFEEAHHYEYDYIDKATRINISDKAIEFIFEYNCPKCFGTGKIPWIEEFFEEDEDE